jgi:hypothetical protein
MFENIKHAFSDSMVGEVTNLILAGIVRGYRRTIQSKTIRYI